MTFSLQERSPSMNSWKCRKPSSQIKSLFEIKSITSLNSLCIWLTWSFQKWERRPIVLDNQWTKERVPSFYIPLCQLIIAEESQKIYKKTIPFKHERWSKHHKDSNSALVFVTLPHPNMRWKWCSSLILSRAPL